MLGNRGCGSTLFGDSFSGVSRGWMLSVNGFWEDSFADMERSSGVDVGAQFQHKQQTCDATGND